MAIKKAFNVGDFYKRRTQPEKILQTQINFVEMAQRALAADIESGATNPADPEYSKRMSSLNKMATDLIDAKVSYAKTAQALAGRMTADEILQAAVDRISIEPKSVIKKVVAYFQDLLEQSALAKMAVLDSQGKSASEDVFKLLSEPDEADDE